MFLRKSISISRIIRAFEIDFAAATQECDDRVPKTEERMTATVICHSFQWLVITFFAMCHCCRAPAIKVIALSPVKLA